MNYNHKQINGVDVIELVDSIDLYSAPQIKKFAKTLLTDSERKIVISLEKTNFLDSSGLGMLVNLFFECRQREIQIKMASLSEKAKKIFVVAKLTDTYETYETLEEAMQSFH